jgi:hypothetical protein
MSNEETEFESDKQVEEYADELNEISKALAIEPEKFPDGQPIENVAEVIEKPTKKKSAEVKKTDMPAPVIAPVIISPPVQQEAQATEVKPIEPTPTVPQEKPIPEVNQPEPQAPVFGGIDNYIETTAEAIGQNAKETFRQNAYRNLLAVVNGQVRLVPIQQEPEPQPEPQPNPLIQLQQIELALKDPANQQYFKQLIQRKCELLGIPFDESMLQPIIPPPAVPLESKPPVSSKLSEPKKEKPKRSNMSKLKLIGLSVSLAFVVTVAVILAIAMLSH